MISPCFARSSQAAQRGLKEEICPTLGVDGGKGR